MTDPKKKSAITEDTSALPLGVPGIDKAYVDVSHLPGLVIFVHGVNSDGEWFEAAEEGLINGLNTRLALDKGYSEGRLWPTSYLPELKPDGSLNREYTGKKFITSPGRSPVIRFRWGYKAAAADSTKNTKAEAELYAGRIYLNELDAWGGGPFQNGTSALPYMWGDGLDDRVFLWLYANMFPIAGREVYACPPRAYYAHAAHRLKELIKAIRAKQADCPITVVCHSQGNMVTLAAAFLGEKEGALADTYVLCNPPYNLDSLGMDALTNVDSRSAVGNLGGVTTMARMTTFANFLALIKARALKQDGQTLELINRYYGFKDVTTGKTYYRLGEFPSRQQCAVTPVEGQDRDNRAKVFLYCNPHDQVIGVSPVQGIGWRGVSNYEMDRLAGDGVLYQRVWAAAGGRQRTAFQVGCPTWTNVNYRYRDDNHDPKQFWHPLPPRMQYTLTTNPSQGVVAKVIAIAFAPTLWVITNTFNLRINSDPSRDWAVAINAPALREPLKPYSVRYGAYGDFDEGLDPARDALAKKGDFGKLSDARYGGAYEASGSGTVDSEASLRYEHAARLRAARERGMEPSVENERVAVKRMLAENPNATDHSTILANPAHCEKVLAYDVAIGWVNPSKITAENLMAFRQFAHWMLLDKLQEALPVSLEFTEYLFKGFYNHHPLQFFYNVQHMAVNAPGIVDDRERNLLGYLRG